jgi:hypothetical protein
MEMNPRGGKKKKYFITDSAAKPPSLGINW